MLALQRTNILTSLFLPQGKKLFTPLLKMYSLLGQDSSSLELYYPNEKLC